MIELVFASVIATAVMQEMGIKSPIAEFMKKSEVEIVAKTEPTREEKQLLLKKKINDAVHNETNASISESKIETKVVWVFETK